MTGLEGYLHRPTWVEIDLDAIAYNIREVRRRVGDNVKIIAALKANAYGHGILPVAKTAFANGADMLGVGNIDEAIFLRKQGIRGLILVFGNTLPSEAPTYTKYELIPSLFNPRDPEVFARVAQKPLNVFAKIDTGLGRLGILPQEAICYIEKILRYPNLRLVGIYTHFGAAAGKKDKGFVEHQFRLFKDIITELTNRGIHIPIQQAANSAAVVDMPHTYLTAVCVGHAIYGALQMESPKVNLQLRRAMTGFKSRLISLRKFPRESNISGFTTLRESIIGVAPVGCADGYPATLAGRGAVLVRGRRVPVIGSVSLEHIKIDLTEVDKVEIGDEVVLMGRQGEEAIWWEEIAEITGSPIIEILTSPSPSLPRVYYIDGRPALLISNGSEWSIDVGIYRSYHER